MNVLHLPSWFPTPENPTLGNFCLRMIQSLPEDCRSVVLSVCEGEGSKPFFIREMQEKGFVHVQIVTPTVRSRLLRLCVKWLAYQYGFSYVRKRCFRPDLLHVHVAWPAGRLALQWRRWRRLPYVLTEHWTIYQPQNAALLRGALKRRIRRVANGASRIMPVSDDLRRNMESIGIHRPFRVIYNVVDTDLFRLAETAEEGRKKRMLHVSTLRDEAKNFSGILRTLVRLRQERDDFELHVIHDYEAPVFQAFIKDNHLEDCVFLHGKKTSAEVAEAYALSDFLLLFSRFENLPCVIVEAMASGLPVLSTDVGGIAEILSPERGLLIASEDEEALLQGMRQLLDTCHTYDKEAIRAYAVRTFSPAVIGRQLAEVYAEVLGEGSLRG